MQFLHPIVTEALLARVIGGIPGRQQGIHGLSHWLRVERNGLFLAEAEGADPVIVSLFALFHDSQRINDDTDPDHGRRGSWLAEHLHAEGLLPINPGQLEQLVYACSNHTDVTYSADATIGCCWDADRLDLTRIGVDPDPEMLNTDSAKRLAASKDYSALAGFVWRPN